MRLSGRLDKAKRYLTGAHDQRAIGFGILASILTDEAALHHPDGFKLALPAIRNLLEHLMNAIPLDRYASLRRDRTLNDVKGLTPDAMRAKALEVLYELETLESAMYTLSSFQAVLELHAGDSHWKSLQKVLLAKLAKRLNEDLSKGDAAEFQMDLVSGRKDVRQSFLKRIVREDLKRLAPELEFLIPEGAYLNLLSVLRAAGSHEFEVELKNILLKDLLKRAERKKDIKSLKKDIESREALLRSSLFVWVFAVYEADQIRSVGQMLEKSLSELLKSVLDLEHAKSFSKKWKGRKIESFEDQVEFLEDYSKTFDDLEVEDALLKARREVEREFQDELFQAVKANELTRVRQLIFTRAYSKDQLSKMRDPLNRRSSLLSQSTSKEMTDLLKIILSK
jgi:hypothetical protein